MSKFYLTARNFKIDTDWFILCRVRNGKHDLSHFLDQINLDRYIIFKATRSFREVGVNNLYQLEYATYILFKKEIYKREDMNIWMEFVNDIGLRFLVKPFPPIKYINRIKIIQ